MPTTLPTPEDYGPTRDPDSLPDSTDPSGPCPRCGRVSNFTLVEAVALSFKKGVYAQTRGGPERIPEQRTAILECHGCQQRIVVIEDQYVGGVRNGNSGLITWHGIHWWPTPGADSFDPAVPPPVAAAYDEAIRCLSAGAPNGAAVLLRNALAAIVADKGSEGAKAKRDLSQQIKQMIQDGGPLGALGDWAEHVNLYGNAGAHPDAYGDVSPDEAKDTAKLTRSMIDLLYETPAKFARRRSERGR